MKKILLFVTILLSINTSKVMAQIENIENANDKLVVIWTSDDPYVAERVAFMYTHNAKKRGWFKEVTLIIWGPSAKLAAENLKIQEQLKAMKDDGVVIEGCISCANEYGVVENLKAQGFDIKGMGVPLTEYLKSGAKVLTF